MPLHAADVDLVMTLCQDPMPRQTGHRWQTVQQVVERMQLFAEADLEQVSGSGLAL